jgi:hypothetical protein
VTERTYSSYQLDQFQTCPKLWDLSKRWRAPEVSWQASMHVGACIAVGLASLRQKSAKRVAEIRAMDEINKRYIENDEWTLDGIIRHVYKGIELGISSNLGLKTILSADQQMYGRCRPDVVGRTHDGRLRIWDDKVKLKLDSRYIDDTLSEFRHSNQLYEYAWEVGRYYGEPVEKVGVNLIILTPSPKVIPYPIEITPEAIEYWASGAVQDFSDMALIDGGFAGARPRWTSCTTKYNMPGTFQKALCPMHLICHDLHGDESRAEAFYERK